MANALRAAKSKEKEVQLTEIEKELYELDDSKLPNAIAQRMDDLAEINAMYEVALNKKEAAQKSIKTAYESAKNLVNKAKELGKLDPKTHSFFGHVWSTKGDRIEALERCVKTIGEYGGDTAELQQKIVDIQKATLESQDAVVQVQKYQMEYLEGTVKALKFLYGLSAYGIASTESIVTNLDLILSGAKKKELGEMAKQQMFLVMDQLKSQENLHNRMDKTEDSIEDLREEFRRLTEEDSIRDRKIQEGELKDNEQDALLERHQKKVNDHEETLAIQKKKDEEHDEAILAHEEKLYASALKDEEQDQILAEISEKGRAWDGAIAQGIEEDSRQNKAIAELNEKIQHVIDDNNSLRKENRTGRIAAFIAVGVGVFSMILSILQVFI